MSKKHDYIYFDRSNYVLSTGTILLEKNKSVTIYSGALDLRISFKVAIDESNLKSSISVRFSEEDAHAFLTFKNPPYGNHIGAGDKIRMMQILYKKNEIERTLGISAQVRLNIFKEDPLCSLTYTVNAETLSSET